MNDFLEMMFGGGSKMSPSQEMDALGERKKKEKADQQARSDTLQISGSRHGGGGGSMGDPLWMQLLQGGANPQAVQTVLANSYGHATVGDAAGTKNALRGAFSKDSWDPGSFGLHGGTYAPQRAGRGGMMMPQAPAPEKQSQARLDLNDFYERRRERAGMQDQLNFRKQLLQQIMGSIGGGGGQIHESGMHEQLFNNAGAPRAIPLRNESTRDMTPQERASLISAMLQGF